MSPGQGLMCMMLEEQHGPLQFSIQMLLLSLCSLYIILPMMVKSIVPATYS